MFTPTPESTSGRRRPFDVVVSAWVIETVADPLAAVTELLRVLAHDGFVVYGVWLPYRL